MQQFPVRVDLLKNVAATGSGIFIPGGKWQFQCTATFSGATIKVQVLGPDNTTYIDTGVTFSAGGISTPTNGIPDGVYKGVVTAGPPSAVYLSAFWISE